MKTIKVKLGPRSYNIHIGEGVTKKLSTFIRPDVPNVPIFVITNQKINSLYGKKIKRALTPISKNICVFKVPDSEKAKSFSIYIKTMKSLAKFARKTKPILFALGGGVIGDLTGFVASTYRRGVPYVQIPTTLLAQVDSAIGGKVAIDIKEAKNIVGDFYQPKLVLCDLGFLKTLPQKELRNGLVELVKYGIIKDKKLFEFIEKNISKILKSNIASLERIVFKSCSIKASVVAKDEFDTKDVRAILNFGHTIGHAIEAASQYKSSIKHGQAVAIGMLMASFIALKLRLLRKRDHERLCALVKKVAPKTSLKTLNEKNILKSLSYDKKFVKGTNKFILPVKIGRVRVVTNIPQDLIKEALRKKKF